MPNNRRPRVATIGLDEAQVASIRALCGTLREAPSLYAYLQRYDWTETDVVVASVIRDKRVDVAVNLLGVGSMSFTWSDSYRTGGGPPLPHYISTDEKNTERELSIPSDCPDSYEPLAGELARQLASAEEPPDTFATTRRGEEPLIETTSGHAVALRIVLPQSQDVDGREHSPIALFLPDTVDLAAWLRAFLYDIHDLDPDRVPHPPPRLNQPSDWYTSEERDLAETISEVETELKRLQVRREELKAELGAAGQRAEEGVRRILWLDGDELATAASETLGGLGFTVRDMDAELEPRQQKREDLRLTLDDAPGWEAIVEIKGYTNGTRTSDSRQVREQRERYIKEEKRAPDLTLWLCNPYREMDPSSRPIPDQNVQEAAENVGAVHALTTDLYRQWALVAAGELEAEAVIQSLVDAEPGLWAPPDTYPGS
ncbi:MAG: hypothetical protein F4Y92_03965 [Dehalococcoidia bacterium]|nr:hypothetical protein [Dehalococcoidia bacterium]